MVAMASRSSLAILLASFSLLLASTSALQVTPNSPCASFCLDSNDLDYSDPNSSTTKDDDITCEDSKFLSQPAGQKYQRCMSCLQTSRFSQGEENDQQWFLYNLRFSFDHCIFGKDVGSNPCQTSTACGALEAALKDGELDPLKLKQYSYCDAAGGVFLTNSYDKCLQCIKVGNDHQYLTNFLIALEAGCRQKPIAGQIVGLNDTVFSETHVQMVEPSASAAPAGQGLKLPATTVAIIAVASLVVVLLAAGCGYMQYRKRKFRKYGRRNVHSGLSFRCRTNMPPPISPELSHKSDESLSISIDEKPHLQPVDEKSSIEYIPSNHSPTSTKPNLWNPHNAMQSFQGLGRTPSTKSISKEPLPLRTITTSLPMHPPTVHQSPMQRVVSPQDPFATPTSAQSTAPLLPFKPYVPAEFGASSPNMGPGNFSPAVRYASPTSGTTASPLMSQGAWPLPMDRRPMESPGWEPQRNFANVPAWSGRPTGRLSGSPVESRQLQTSFPAPPRR